MEMVLVYWKMRSILRISTNTVKFASKYKTYLTTLNKRYNLVTIRITIIFGDFKQKINNPKIMDLLNNLNTRDILKEKHSNSIPY